MKKLFLIIILLAVANVNALMYLPDDGAIESGYREYTNDNLYIRVDCAVYDTFSAAFGNQSLVTNTGEGQYLYVYQIMTAYEQGYAAVASFGIPGVDSTNLTGIGTQDDGEDGSVDADSVDGSSLLWTFSEGALVDGTHSYFLTLSSDAAPVAGDYEITVQSENEGWVPGETENPVPEPATVLFVALGAAGLFRKIRRG